MKDRDLRGTTAEKDFFLIFEEDDYKLTRKKLIQLFARTKSGPPRYRASDIISIGPDRYPDIYDKSTTTAGIFVMNKVLIERLKHFGYINKTFTAKTFRAIDDGLAFLLLEGLLDPQTVFSYIDHMEYLLGGPLSHIINPSMDISVMKLPDSTRKLRAKLLEENADAIRKGDTVAVAKMEKILTDHAMAELRKTNSPALAYFDSGCGIDESIFKETFIMKGPVIDNSDPSGAKYKVITSCYDDGIKVEDMAANNDSFVTGAYQKGISTGISGYYTKKYNSMYLEITLLEKGSDCGTKKTMPILVTKENANGLKMYHYIMEKGKPVLLTPMNIQSYIGKVVELRTPGLCEAEAPHFCNICYGDLPYRRNRTNVGTFYAVIPSSAMNQALKKWHVSTVTLRQITESELSTFLPK